ncbi:hypothetical protein [Micromonospora tulbaghiae]|uniref:hypothetical protein n=1 Tax=Micromonospora tulbaghiae TaxID=479978 RepID=UPI0013C51BF1|nr:hypothetical protein [Micromonospora tulbaghiae]
MNIVGGIIVADGTEAKGVTGAGDPSRSAVAAKMVRTIKAHRPCKTIRLPAGR